MFSLTIRENILFGRPFNERLYEQVINDSCLKTDIEMMIEGDKTTVGERGITLSGGQKARLSLARALYSNSDILLVDDPLSAVDSKVARLIFNKCLKVLSQSKTVILVTHQIGFLM